MEMAPYSLNSQTIDPSNENFLETQSLAEENPPTGTLADRLLNISENIIQNMENCGSENGETSDFHINDFSSETSFNCSTPTIQIKEELTLPLDLDSLKKIEAYEIIRKNDAIRQAAARMRETPEQRAKRLERERIRVREKRRQESPEQREKRLMKARERVRVRRSMETTEERQKRLKHNCEATRKARKERKEAWEAFTRASSVTTEGFEDNLIMTPPPIMNATQEILNRLLENSLLQQSAPSLPQLNTEFNLIKQESPILDKKPILEYTDEVFFLMVKKEFEQLNQAQRETAKMKVLEALLLVKHSDNILT